MGPDLALSDCEAYSLLRSGDKEGSPADYFMAPVAMTLPIIGADIPGPPLQCLSEQKAVSPGHCAAHLYSRTRDGYLENDRSGQRDATQLVDAKLKYYDLDLLFPSMCTQEAETTGGELYLTFGDATLEMGNPYQVDNCSQQSTEIWPGGSMGQINNMKYRCDGPLRPFGEFQQSADVIHKRANALGARHQSEAPQKKSFPCTYASCLRTFTTKYRLNTHVNRFHTAPEQQVSYQCDNCPYTTCYKTDLPRHKKTCSDLA